MAAVREVKSAVGLRRLVSSFSSAESQHQQQQRYNSSPIMSRSGGSIERERRRQEDDDLLEDISAKYGIEIGTGGEFFESATDYNEEEGNNEDVENSFDDESTEIEEFVPPPPVAAVSRKNPKLSPILTSSKNFDDILAQHKAELQSLREQFSQVQQDHKNEISSLKAQLKNSQEELKEKQYETCLMEEIQTLENRISEIKQIKDVSLKSELCKELKLSERHLASARQDLAEIKEAQKRKAEEKKMEAQLQYEIQTLEKQISDMRPSSANSFQQSISPQLKFKQRLLARAKQQLVDIKNKRDSA
uniref:Uncharacterized protein n=1 Tax=viral metagenome TaxID=1070528 RepID=A0A6C0HWX5_9ZZZZ